MVLPIPRYGLEAPSILGAAIPNIAAGTLLASHQDTIHRIVDCIDPETPELEGAVRNSIARFADWVHLLPASECHHHCYQGGLLSHSLEVSLWSAQSARGRLGDLNLPGWERRHQERTFVLAIALSGLLHDLGKPVADLLILDPTGELAWNPYRGSLKAWADEGNMAHYHLHWLKGRGTRHRGFALLILRSVIEPLLFDRIREVGPELEATLLNALTQDALEGNMAAHFVAQADRESTVRALKDPRRQYTLGAPLPEMIFVHAMRQLVQRGIWEINTPGSPLWHLEDQTYLSWPRASQAIQTLLEQDHVTGIPFDPDLMAHFMLERGLLVSTPSEEAFSSPYQNIQPACLETPLKMVQLKSPRLIFAGPLPDSMIILRVACRETNPTVQKNDPPSLDQDRNPITLDTPTERNIQAGPLPSTTNPSVLEHLQSVSDQFEWQILEQHLFIPHPEAARAMGLEPLVLIERMETHDWLEPGGAGSLRKVRVIDGKRGLLLNLMTSTALSQGMKVPKKKSRRRTPTEG